MRVVNARAPFGKLSFIRKKILMDESAEKGRRRTIFKENK